MNNSKPTGHPMSNLNWLRFSLSALIVVSLLLLYQVVDANHGPSFLKTTLFAFSAFAFVGLVVFGLKAVKRKDSV